MKKKKKTSAYHKSGRSAKLPAVLEKRVKQEQDILIGWIAQLSLDIMVSVLNDPDVMGKDVFGAKRLSKVGVAFNEKFPIYFEAISTSEEADYRRTKIDQEQERIFGKNCAKWKERYAHFQD